MEVKGILQKKRPFKNSRMGRVTESMSFATGDRIKHCDRGGLRNEMEW